MMRLLASFVLLLVSMVPMLPQNRAEAAGARECDLYARRAVQQYQLTLMARFARRCGVSPKPALASLLPEPQRLVPNCASSLAQIRRGSARQASL